MGIEGRKEGGPGKGIEASAVVSSELSNDQAQHIVRDLCKVSRHYQHAVKKKE